MACNYFCDGVDKAPQRSLFNALGMTKEEMDRPLVGIVSSYNEIVPGHMNIDKIVEAVKMGVARTQSWCAGANPSPYSKRPPSAHSRKSRKRKSLTASA